MAVEEKCRGSDELYGYSRKNSSRLFLLVKLVFDYGIVRYSSISAGEICFLLLVYANPLYKKFY